MKEKYIVLTFQVTETLKNGKERTIKKEIYSKPFENGKHIILEDRIKKSIELLKENNFYNIKYLNVKETYLYMI